MRVGVVAIPGTFDSALTSVLDILRVAELLRPSVDAAIPPVESALIGLRPTIRTANGFIVESTRDLTDPMDDLDVLVIPALGAITVPEVEMALSSPEVEELRAVLRSGPASTVARFASACTGSFVLAEAGHLDHVRATTSWWLSGEFARRYPAVELDMTRMVVRSPRTITAGAAFAHIDLAISLVADVSSPLAEATARHLLIDERPSRAIEAALGHLANNDMMVSRFEAWGREHLAEAVTIHQAAEALNVTRRTLERHVRSRTGLTPAQIFQRLRLERARHLRRTTELSMDQIARRVGYASAVTLRRALTRMS